MSARRDTGTTTSVGTITEPECLGPCEPGTSVTLDGVVWQETENGVLVVNVTWREKSYVGTLLDCTRHDWAPPRLCDSPSDSHQQQENDTKSTKGRGKRSAAAAAASRNAKQAGAGRRTANSSGGFTIPASPTGKVPSQPTVSSNSSTNSSPGPKKSALSGRDLALIECPEPNCNKKYKHINGLKYHQTHAHGDKVSAAAAAAAAAAVVVPAEKTENDTMDHQSDQKPVALLPIPLVATAASTATEVDSEPVNSEAEADAEASSTSTGTEEKDVKPEPAVIADAAGPSSPAYSDISDANEECEEQGRDESEEDRHSVDGNCTANSGPGLVAASDNKQQSLQQQKSPQTQSQQQQPPQQQSYASFSFPNFRSREEQAFPYSYTFPPAFSLPPDASSNGTTGCSDQRSGVAVTGGREVPSVGSESVDGQCPTMETTGPPPPAPTSSFFYPPHLSYPHFEPMFRMFPPATRFSDKKLDEKSVGAGSVGVGGGSPSVAVSGVDSVDSGSVSGSRSPPTQRHLHTHHHTHVGVPFAPYHPVPVPHPISAFPILHPNPSHFTSTTAAASSNNSSDCKSK